MPCQNYSKDSTIVGSKKTVRVKILNSCLTVVGNNNSIEVEKNRGKIEVIGNHCCLSIKDNDGEVVMVGNKGVINVAGPEDGVRCTGLSCRVNTKVKGFKHCNIQGATASKNQSLHTLGFDLRKVMNLSAAIDRGLETLPT